MYILSNEEYQSSKSFDKNNYKYQNNKSYNLDKKKILKKILLNILLIIIFSTIMFIGINFVVVDSSEAELVEVKIEDGDNLWKIADRFYEDDVDLRRIIYEIKRINKLDSAMLKPGQKLKIPVYK